MSTVATSSSRAGAVVFSLSFARLGVQLVASVLIARTIGPSSYGIAAFVLLFGSFAELLKESGLAAPIVSQAALTRKQVRTATSRGLIVGIAAGMVAFALLWLASVVSGVEAYVPLAAIALLVFPIAGVTGVRSALLVRDFRTVTLGSIELGSAIVSTALGVSLALLGAGAGALVAQAVVFSILVGAGVWVVRPARNLRSGDSARSSWTTDAGLRIAFSQLINNAVGSFDRLTLGLLASPGQVGSYAQAYQLFAVPLQFLSAPAQRLTVPQLSFRHRNGTPVAPIYVRAVRRLTIALWPLYAVLFVVAPLLIQILLGTAWRDTGTILRVLSIAACAQLIGYATGWLFLATAQAQKQLAWALLSRPLVVVAVLVGLPWGSVGVAWGVSIVSVLLVLPGLVYAGRAVGVSPPHLFRAVTWPAVTAAAAAFSAGVAYLGIRATEAGDLLTMLVAVTAGAVGAIASIFAIPTLRRELVGLGRELTNSTGSRIAAPTREAEAISESMDRE